MAANHELCYCARCEAERKVIEAAKAWTDDDDRHPRYAQFLMLAVEQLRALEAEEE